MPRRIPDYALQFTNFNVMISIGAFIFGFSQLLFLYNVIATVRKRGTNKDVVADRVWEGSHGLEWTLPSPPPYHTFTTPPTID